MEKFNFFLLLGVSWESSSALMNIERSSAEINNLVRNSCFYPIQHHQNSASSYTNLHKYYYVCMLKLTPNIPSNDCAVSYERCYIYLHFRTLAVHTVMADSTQAQQGRGNESLFFHATRLVLMHWENIGFARSIFA